MADALKKALEGSSFEQQLLGANNFLELVRSEKFLQGDRKTADKARSTASQFRAGDAKFVLDKLVGDAQSARPPREGKPGFPFKAYAQAARFVVPQVNEEGLKATAEQLTEELLGKEAPMPAGEDEFGLFDDFDRGYEFDSYRGRRSRGGILGQIERYSGRRKNRREDEFEREERREKDRRFGGHRIQKASFFLTTLGHIAAKLPNEKDKQRYLKVLDDETRFITARSIRQAVTEGIGPIAVTLPSDQQLRYYHRVSGTEGFKPIGPWKKIKKGIPKLIASIEVPDTKEDGSEFLSAIEPSLRSTDPDLRNPSFDKLKEYVFSRPENEWVDIGQRAGIVKRDDEYMYRDRERFPQESLGSQVSFLTEVLGRAQTDDVKLDYAKTLLKHHTIYGDEAVPKLGIPPQADIYGSVITAAKSFKNPEDVNILAGVLFSDIERDVTDKYGLSRGVDQGQVGGLLQLLPYVPEAKAVDYVRFLQVNKVDYAKQLAAIGDGGEKEKVEGIIKQAGEFQEQFGNTLPVIDYFQGDDWSAVQHEPRDPEKAGEWKKQREQEEAKIAEMLGKCNQDELVYLLNRPIEEPDVQAERHSMRWYNFEDMTEHVLPLEGKPYLDDKHLSEVARSMRELLPSKEGQDAIEASWRTYHMQTREKSVHEKERERSDRLMDLTKKLLSESTPAEEKKKLADMAQRLAEGEDVEEGPRPKPPEEELMKSEKVSHLLTVLGRTAPHVDALDERRDIAQRIKPWVTHRNSSVKSDAINALGAIVPTLPEDEWESYSSVVDESRVDFRGDHGQTTYYRNLAVAAESPQVQQGYIDRLCTPVEPDQRQISRGAAEIPRSSVDELITLADLLQEKGKTESAASIRQRCLPIVKGHLGEGHNQQVERDLKRLSTLLPHLSDEDKMDGVLIIADAVRPKVVIEGSFLRAMSDPFSLGEILDKVDPEGKKKREKEQPEKVVHENPAAELIRNVFPSLNENQQGKVLDHLVERLNYKPQQKEDPIWRDDPLEELQKGNDVQNGAAEFLHDHIRTLAVADQVPWIEKIHRVYRTQLEELEEIKKTPKKYGGERSSREIETARKSLSGLRLAQQMTGKQSLLRNKWDQLEEDANLKALAESTGQPLEELKKKKNAIALLDYLKGEERMDALEYDFSDEGKNIFGKLHDALTSAKKKRMDSDGKVRDLFGKCSPDEQRFLLDAMLNDANPDKNAGSAYREIADLVFPRGGTTTLPESEASSFGKRAIAKLGELHRADREDMNPHLPRSLIHALGRAGPSLADGDLRKQSVETIAAWTGQEEPPQIIRASIDGLTAIVPVLSEQDWPVYSQRVSETLWDRRVNDRSFAYFQELGTRAVNPEQRTAALEALMSPIRNPEKEGERVFDPEPVPFGAANAVLKVSAKLGDDESAPLRKELRDKAVEAANSDKPGWKGGAYQTIGTFIGKAEGDEKLELVMALTKGLTAMSWRDSEDMLLNKWRSNPAPDILKEHFPKLESGHQNKVLDAVFDRLQTPELEGDWEHNRQYSIQIGAANFLYDHVSKLSLEDQKTWLADIHGVYQDQGRRAPRGHEGDSASYHLAKALMENDKRLKQSWRELERESKKR